MATLNSGNQVRFENGGIVLIGADDVLNIVAGTLEWEEMGREAINQMDRGALKTPIRGNERPCRVRLDVYLAPNTLKASDIRAKVLPADTSGAVTYFTMTVKIPVNLGSTNYAIVLFSYCFLADGLKYRASSGADFDRLTLEITDNETAPGITPPS